MKIGIDLRFINDHLYSSFVLELVNSIIKDDKENKYIIYLNKDINLIESPNIEKKIININNWSLKEQFSFLKILKKDNNNTMLFFNEYKPIMYRWDYITIIWSLKEVYYMNFNSYITKYRFLFLMEKNLKNSRKVVCLDKQTKNELVEKYNIKEDKIDTINWFFPKNKTESNTEEKEIDINIKNKFLIKNDYIIYSWWDSIEKNYEKIIHVIDRLKNDNIEIDLVFLWNNISKNIHLRNQILDLWLEKNIYFLWSPDVKTKKHLYNESLFTIFPSFYETFPFRLSEPVYFKTKILSSNLKNIKKVFWDNVEYFSPISVNSIYKTVKDFIIKNEGVFPNIDYDNVLEKYSLENTKKQLLEIMK